MDLEPNQISALSAAQLQALTPAQIQSFTPQQLQALSIQQLADLTPIQLQSMSTSQLQNLTSQQIASLIEPLGLLGVQIVKPGVAPYTGSDTVASGGSIVEGDQTNVSGRDYVVVYNADTSQWEVFSGSSPLPGGSFAGATGGTVPTATAPTAPLQPIQSTTVFTTVPSTPLPSNEIYIPGTPWYGLVGVADGTTGWYSATDPSDSNFQIRYNPKYHNDEPYFTKPGYEILNTKTGAVGLIDDSYTKVIKTGPDPDTWTTIDVDYERPGFTYQEAYQAYVDNYTGAPDEWAKYNYVDVGFSEAPSDGVHTFVNTAAPNALIGGTGVWNDAGDSTAFAPPSGQAAAVVGGTGSISQTLSGLQAGQWYSLSLKAMTTAFEQAAQSPSGTADTNLGRVAASAQSFNVLLDGVKIGTFSTSALTDTTDSAASAWQEFTTAAFLGQPGQHTLTIQGLAPNGATSSATIDSLNLLQVQPVGSVPEPAGGISSTPVDQMSSISGLQLVADNDDDLQKLSQQQFQQLTPGQLSYFYGASINRFTPQQLSWLTTTQIAGLQPDQVAWLSADTLNSFSIQQLQALQRLSSLSNDNLQYYLSTNALSEFTAAQVATLSRSQLEVLTPTRVQALNPGVWPLFTATQLSAFSSFQLSALPDSSLAAISSEAMAGLAKIATGGNLNDWIGNGGTASQGTDSTLSGALLMYEEDVPGATPDFANAIFKDTGLASGSISQGDTSVGVNGVTFTGTAGITADNSILNSYLTTVTVPVGETNINKYLSSKDVANGDIYWDASYDGDGNGDTVTKTVKIANNSTDGSGDAAYVTGNGAVNLAISGLTAGQDYQIAVNTAQAYGNAGSEQVEVLVDGKEVGLFTPGTKYSTFETDGFTLTTPGPHTVTLEGFDSSGTSDSALLSSVHIALASDAVVLSGGALLKDGTFVEASSNQPAVTTAPSASAWSFAGDAGVAGPLSAAFIGTGGAVSQTVHGFENNRTYSIAFESSQGSIGSTQAIQVLVDGNVVDTVTPSDTNFRLQYSATFQPGAGAHLIAFRGIGGSGSVNITNVRVLATGFSSDCAAIANGSFEPAQGAWQFTGGSRIVANDVHLPVAPSGNNAAALVGNSSISQEVCNFQPGQPYEITFRAAQMPGSNQTINVLVDGTVVATFTPGNQYGVYTSRVFSPDPGTHRVTFEATNPSGGTVLLNDVELALLPAGQDTVRSNSGDAVITRVGDQDELQRLQWASLAIAAQNDTTSAPGGDDLLGVAPDTSGLSAIDSIAANPFVLGWKNGATAASSWLLSDDGKSVIKHVAETDGATFDLSWTNAGSPSGSATASQTYSQESVVPASRNGSLPLNSVLAAGGPAIPKANPLSTQTNANAAASVTKEPPPLTAMPAFTLPPKVSLPPRGPNGGFGAVQFVNAANKVFLQEWISNFYWADPAFQAMWDKIVNSGIQIKISMSGDIPDAGGEDFLSSISQYNGTGQTIDHIYLNMSDFITAKSGEPVNGNTAMQLIFSSNLMRSALLHELYHSWQDYQAKQYATQTLGLSTSNGDANNWVTAYEAAPLSCVLSSKQISALLANGVPATFLWMPVCEFSSYYAEYRIDPSNPTPMGIADFPPSYTSDNDGYFTAGQMDLIAQAVAAPNGDLFAAAPPSADAVTLAARGNLQKAFKEHPDMEQAILQSDISAGLWHKKDTALTPQQEQLLKKLIADANRIAKYQQAQGWANTVDAFVSLINDLQKGGLANDLDTLAAALQTAGLLPNIGVKIGNTQALLADSQFVSTVASLISAFKNHSTAGGFAAASAVASEVASQFTGSAAGLQVNPFTGATTGSLAGGANVASAIASVLGDVSLVTGSQGPGSITRDLQYFQAGVGTAAAIEHLFPGNAAAIKALGNLANGVGDVLGIIQGFQQGGVLGGLEAGFSANALADLLGASNAEGLIFLSSAAVPIAIAIGLAALFFGGHHDDPSTMPDKYDEPNYGQQTANLQGTMGANGSQYTEDPSLINLFAGRTGIQMIEETLALYGSADNAPEWLKPQFNQLKAMFGESATGAGVLSIGDGGSGRHCNNQEVIAAAGSDGQVYQYTQLDSALNQFQTAYANAKAAGQAPTFSWMSAAQPGSMPPSDNYASTSYESQFQTYA